MAPTLVVEIAVNDVLNVSVQPSDKSQDSKADFQSKKSLLSFETRSTRHYLLYPLFALLFYWTELSKYQYTRLVALPLRILLQKYAGMTTRWRDSGGKTHLPTQFHVVKWILFETSTIYSTGCIVFIVDISLSQDSAKIDESREKLNFWSELCLPTLKINIQTLAFLLARTSISSLSQQQDYNLISWITKSVKNISTSIFVFIHKIVLLQTFFAFLCKSR